MEAFVILESIDKFRFCLDPAIFGVFSSTAPGCRAAAFYKLRATASCWLPSPPPNETCMSLLWEPTEDVLILCAPLFLRNVGLFLSPLVSIFKDTTEPSELDFCSAGPRGGLY